MHDLLKTMILFEANARQTESSSFKRWFGDSKVVDRFGEPLLVYHGTDRTDIKKFDPDKAGSVQTSDWGKGIYFTPSKWQADSYREEASLQQDSEDVRLFQDYEDAAKKLGTDTMNASLDLGRESEEYKGLQKYHDAWIKGRKDIRNQKRGKVYSAYVSLKNPLIYQYEGMTDPYLAEQALSHGNDGIIITTDGFEIDEVVAFNSGQIKVVEN